MSGYALEKIYKNNFLHLDSYYHFKIQKNGIRLMSKSRLPGLSRNCFPKNKIYLDTTFWILRNENIETQPNFSDSTISLSHFENIQLESSVLQESIIIDGGAESQILEKNIRKEILKNNEHFKVIENELENGLLIMLFDFCTSDFEIRDLALEVREK